jgi:hypothetical protein
MKLVPNLPVGPLGGDTDERLDADGSDAQTGEATASMPTDLTRPVEHVTISPAEVHRPA